MDLNHLNLRVRDAAACRDFYVRYFGFRPAFEAEGGHFVRNEEGFLLALVPADPHQPLPAGFHVGFGLTAAMRSSDPRLFVDVSLPPTAAGDRGALLPVLLDLADKTRSMHANPAGMVGNATMVRRRSRARRRQVARERR